MPAEVRYRCPRCHAPVRVRAVEATCLEGHVYPVVAGVPIILDESRSVFSLDDLVNHRPTFWPEESPLNRRLRKIVRKYVPNVVSRRMYDTLAKRLLARTKAPRVLVVGGAVLGYGMEVLMKEPAIELVESDISWGPRVQVICDAHDLPFEDAEFDAVVCQAVLEHVLDPVRCVAEIHRVLKADGLVYAETPFMQQVHGGRFDFTRFTHLGHRRLFRDFEEVESGLCLGPGVALAWAWRYFLWSFVTSSRARLAVRAFAWVTGLFWMSLDRLLVNRPAALDAASGLFFLGIRRNEPLTDRELLAAYRGAT